MNMRDILDLWGAMNLGKIANSIEMLAINQMVSNNQQPDMYINRGIAYLKKGYFDLAIADYTQAIRLAPNYTDAYCYRGIAYVEKGYYDLAIADYTQAIRLAPNYTNAYFCRGLAYISKGNRTQARADWTKALQLDPNDQQSRKMLKKYK